MLYTCYFLLIVIIFILFQKFNEKVQKHRCSNFKKNKNEQYRKSISTYVSSVIGTLQCLEQRLFSMIDQAEQSSSNSMTHVVGQLSSFIDVRIIIYRICFYYVLTCAVYSFDPCIWRDNAMLEHFIQYAEFFIHFFPSKSCD